MMLIASMTKLLCVSATFTVEFTNRTVTLRPATVFDVSVDILPTVLFMMVIV